MVLHAARLCHENRHGHHRESEYIEGMLRKVMVVVLLGCVGLTAGVAFGTVFSSNQSRASIPSIQPPAQSSCHQDWRWREAAPRGPRRHPLSSSSSFRCLVQMPSMPVPGSLSGSAPSGGLPMGGYVQFGLLAGLSAAVGFLVPPRSRPTRM